MKTPLTVAVAQLNCVVGDISGNARRILDAVARAKAAGADVVLTPELALCGYPPEDLLLRPAFLQACADELAALAAQVQGITVLVGYPAEQDGLRFNAAAVIRDGRIVDTYFKHRLPNYEVFDEERYFEPGSGACVFELKGVRIGVNICADVWESGAAEVARDAGAELLLVLNASPFHMNKQQRVTRSCASASPIPGCRWPTATWWAGRMNWFSTGAPLPSTRMVCWPGRARPLR
jgi:NAD+ synthase (glutamine-hydrolysing)